MAEKEANAQRNDHLEHKLHRKVADTSARAGGTVKPRRKTLDSKARRERLLSAFAATGSPLAGSSSERTNWKVDPAAAGDKRGASMGRVRRGATGCGERDGVPGRT